MPATSRPKPWKKRVDIQHRGGKGWRLPLIKMSQPGISADITIPVEEGKLYHLRNMNFTGVKLFRTPEVLMKPLFGMTTGDIFSTDKLRKGIENMRKLYGKFGYIDFVPEPDFHPAEDGSDQIDLTLTADEGKQFFIRRIDFSGNTTTRDKVIRREILLDEGDMFNTELWDYSVLRLNQLGYFEMLKKEEAADIKRNPQSNTVDITLKVKERGKNSVGLNGGVSGIAGSFVGFNYSTNNFLGLGETLSLESQLGTRMRDVSLGFTEPYFLDRPLQLGFVVYLRRFNFDQGREASILIGHQPDSALQSAGFAEPAELLAEQPRLLRLGHLSHQAEFRPRGCHLRLRYLQRRDHHRCGQGLLPVHQLQRRRRTEFAERNPHQPHRSVVHLQHRQSSDLADRRTQPVHLHRFRGQHPGRQRQYDSPLDRREVLQTGALAQESRPGLPRLGLADHRLRRQVHRAVLPHLHRRRTGCPRLRDLGHHSHRLCRLQRQRQRVERRWQPAHPEDRFRMAS